MYCLHSVPSPYFLVLEIVTWEPARFLSLCNLTPTMLEANPELEMLAVN